MLDQLQENNDDLWGDDVTSKMVLLACDFYNAGVLLSLSDEEDIVKILIEELLPSSPVPEFANANVVDSWVGKYAGTITWFSPGSNGSCPPLECAGKDVLPNLKCVDNWVKVGKREHGAK